MTGAPSTVPFSPRELLVCDRFLRGRIHDWAVYKRSYRSPGPHHEANQLLDRSRRTTAAILMHVLTKDKDEVDRAVREGEQGYFYSRMFGEVMYLLWWVDGWYPAQTHDGGHDVLEGKVRLRLRGFRKYFDREVSKDDAKLRRQLVLLNAEERLTPGFFPVKGDYVKVLLVDDFEAVFFLRPGGFSRGAGTAAEEKQEAEQQQGEPFWCPVGVVVSSLAVKDAAVVRVHFLCCSEVVRVSNTHLVGITQQEYQRNHDRIMAARIEGLSAVERVLSQQKPQLIARRACQVSGEHCLASFWDHYTHLELRLFNTRLSRQLTLSLDDATAARLGLLPPAPDDGGIPTIRDLDLKDKEALCHRLADHILVRRGELYVRGMQDDEQQQPEQQQSEQPAQQGAAQQPLKMQDDDPQLLRQVRGELSGVPVEVGFQAVDHDHIRLFVTHLVGPDSDRQASSRTYELGPLTLAHWRALGFPDLDWLTGEDRVRLCGELLRRLRPCQGYPVLVMDDGTVLLPHDFQPLDTGKDYSQASTALVGEQGYVQQQEQDQQQDLGGSSRRKKPRGAGSRGSSFAGIAEGRGFVFRRVQRLDVYEDPLEEESAAVQEEDGTVRQGQVEEPADGRDSTGGGEGGPPPPPETEEGRVEAAAGEKLQASPTRRASEGSEGEEGGQQERRPSMTEEAETSNKPVGGQDSDGSKAPDGGGDGQERRTAEGGEGGELVKQQAPGREVSGSEAGEGAGAAVERQERRLTGGGEEQASPAASELGPEGPGSKGSQAEGGGGGQQGRRASEGSVLAVVEKDHGQATPAEGGKLQLPSSATLSAQQEQRQATEAVAGKEATDATEQSPRQPGAVVVKEEEGQHEQQAGDGSAAGPADEQQAEQGKEDLLVAGPSKPCKEEEGEAAGAGQEGAEQTPSAGETKAEAAMVGTTTTSTVPDTNRSSDTDDAAAPGPTPAAGSLPTCRRRYLITARLNPNDGTLTLHAHSPQPAAYEPLCLTLQSSDWHAPLHYGPLLWSSHEQQAFLIGLLCDRLVVHHGRLTFDACPLLARRTHGDDGRALLRPVLVHDHGHHFRVSLGDGEEEVLLRSHDMLPSAGIAVQHLQWVPLSLRRHLCARLAMLAKPDGSGGLTVENGPLLVWKAVQRKIREGAGPLMVSIWDLGSDLEVVYRDYSGAVVERARTALHHFQRLVGRELWPLGMADDTKEVALRELVRHVGGRNRRSGFSRFRSLRSKMDEERLALIKYVKHTVMTSEHDVIDHIKRIRPDPNRLPPRDVEFLRRLIYMVEETMKTTKAGDRRKRVEKFRVRPGSRRIQSLFRKEPPPERPICECCYQECEPGGVHGATTCTHEYAVCRVCIIQARTRIVTNKLPGLRVRVTELLRKKRPQLPTAKLAPAEAKRRRREVARWLAARDEARQAARRALLSPLRKFYVGVEVPPRPTKTRRGHKSKHSSSHHHHHHHHEHRPTGLGIVDRIAASMAGGLNSAACSPVSSIGGTDWSTASSAAEEDETDDEEDGPEVDEEHDHEHEEEEDHDEDEEEELHPEGLELPSISEAEEEEEEEDEEEDVPVFRRAFAKTGRPMALAASLEEEDEDEDEDQETAEETKAQPPPPPPPVRRASDEARGEVSRLLDEIVAKVVAAGIRRVSVAMRPVPPPRASSSVAMDAARRVQVLQAVRRVLSSMPVDDADRQQPKAELLGPTTLAEARAILLQGTALPLPPPPQEEDGWEGLHCLVREEVFDVLDGLVTSVEARAPSRPTAEREARVQVLWAVEDLVDAVETRVVQWEGWQPQPAAVALDVDQLIYDRQGRAMASGLMTWMAARRGRTAREREERRMVRAATVMVYQEGAEGGVRRVSVVRRRLSEHLTMAGEYYQQQQAAGADGHDGYYYDASQQYYDYYGQQGYEGEDAAAYQAGEWQEQQDGQGYYYQDETGAWQYYQPPTDGAVGDGQEQQQHEGSGAEYSYDQEGQYAQQEGQYGAYSHGAQYDAAAQDAVHYAGETAAAGYDAQQQHQDWQSAASYEGQAEGGQEETAAAYDGQSQQYQDWQSAGGYEAYPEAAVAAESSAYAEHYDGTAAQQAADGQQQQEGYVYGEGYYDQQQQQQQQEGADAAAYYQAQGGAEGEAPRGAWEADRDQQQQQAQGSEQYDYQAQQGGYYNAQGVWQQQPPVQWQVVEVEYVECNLCGREVDGTWEARVECEACADYDLCMSCHEYYLTLSPDTIAVGEHRPDHPVRVHYPPPAAPDVAPEQGQQAWDGQAATQEGGYYEGQAAQGEWQGQASDGGYYEGQEEGGGGYYAQQTAEGEWQGQAADGTYYAGETAQGEWQGQQQGDGMYEGQEAGQYGEGQYEQWGQEGGYYGGGQ